MANTAFSKPTLDLRAPGFVRVRKGSWWWQRSIVLSGLDYSLLFMAWMLSKGVSDPIYLTGNKTIYYFSVFVIISIQIITLWAEGLYQEGKKKFNYLNIVKSLCFAHGLILLFSFIFRPVVDINQSRLTFSCLMSMAFVCAGRWGINIILQHLRQQKILGLLPIFMICNPENSAQFAQLIKQENRYAIRGSASPKSLDRENRPETLAHLNKLGVTEVFISWDAIKNRMFLCWLFQASGITVRIVPMELKPIYRDIEFNQIEGMTCINFNCPIITGKDFWIKRSFDFCFAVLFLSLTFPLYLAIALAIKLDSPGSIFYRQTRIGLHGKEFRVWKFRTMRSDADKFQQELEALNESPDGIFFKIKDDPRITKVGKFLRRYSLDELPQIFNVLCGEMSVVGPRPLPTRDVDKFSERHFIRHEVLPGITGLWQVSGRSNILDFEQVVNLDLHYIEHWSLKLDLKILIKTIKVVFQKEGAY
ncbi:sugar transferase [Merismopedia glauca]|uniref:Glucosyl transferase n=1 Tax=Merismopedia glauca CCAP 1448/3 TaxID=1296344 RepID=A0A2T1C1Q8_9CYAN|nr:sugar transferase [Merismopedia glauca]PSB02087.1 glucosyl transferase [Merismopedia glauca CCAP 1448/3]